MNMDSDKINVCGDDGICFTMSNLLHRYHKVDQYLIDSLIYNYLWFSNPLDFNDPYDCELNLNTSNASYEEIYNYLKEGFDKDNRGRPYTYLEQRTKYLFSNPVEMEKCESNSNKDAVKQRGICCFSESDDSLLMWSHYANKHKGVCLTFNVSKDKDIFTKHPYLVEYPPKYPVFNWPRDRGTFKPLRLLISTKSKEWEYENEVRIVRNSYDVKDKYRGKVEFDKNALLAIKFGYKNDESEQITIKAILEKVGGYEHVKFYKAKLKRFEFGVEYEEIFS